MRAPFATNEIGLASVIVPTPAFTVIVSAPAAPAASAIAWRSEPLPESWLFVTVKAPALPEVASMAEAGYPEIKGESWFAVVVPARTPKDIIALLNHEIVGSIALPDMKERLATLGYAPVGNAPEECAAQFRADMAQWGGVIRAAGIKAE